MAKGIGLIGNFKGKVGNTVGYKLTASNNGQTQGIRVYQPIVKNPKSAGQAEQRAKLLAVNATYRALKMVIDRGNEGLPYGNKSRLAWLKGALKAELMPWIEKGNAVAYPVSCQLTKGSLSGVRTSFGDHILNIQCPGMVEQDPVATVGNISTALLAGYPALKAGDQITIVLVGNDNVNITSSVISFIIDTNSADSIDGFTAAVDILKFSMGSSMFGGCVIVSREGDSGQHLRSTTFLSLFDEVAEGYPYNDDAKDEAIASYRASAAANSDWAEESIQ